MAHLTPRQKAAVVFTSLPAESAQRLLEELTPEQASDLTLEAWQLPELTLAEREMVVAEFLAEPLADRPFAWLNRVPPEQVAVLALREHPRTIAHFLAQLDLDQALAVLGLLPAVVRARVVEEAVAEVVGAACLRQIS